MTEATESELPATDAMPSVGERLMQARQSQGLSLGEMARQLKLSVKQVDALERDDYRLFPGPLWVRGFLRNYAKVLGLDAEALVQKAGLAPEAQGEIPHTAMPTTPASAGRERRRVVIMIFAFVVLGLFVLGLLGQRASRHGDGGTPAEVPVAAPSADSGAAAPVLTDPAAPGASDLMSPEGQSAGATAVVPSTAPPADGAAPRADPVADPGTAGTAPTLAPATLPESTVEAAKPDAGVSAVAPAGPAAALSSTSPVGIPAAPGTGAPASGSAAIGTPAPVPAADAASSPGATVVPLAEGRPAASTTAPAASTPSDIAGAAPAPPAVEVKPRTIRFTFTQSVDMRVVDADGKVLMASLQAAGSQKAVRGLPPFSVAVGNVHAVQIVYRGRTVDLTSRGRTGASKVTLN